jgi:hypothetical protein
MRISRLVVSRGKKIFARTSGQPAGKPYISIQGYGTRHCICRDRLILYMNECIHSTNY